MIGASGAVRNGVRSRDRAIIHLGDPLTVAESTGGRTSLAELTLLAPCLPSKFICLCNRQCALAGKLGQAVPAEPLYLLQSPASHLATTHSIKAPRGDDGRITCEGQLGIGSGDVVAASAWRTLKHAFLVLPV